MDVQFVTDMAYVMSWEDVHGICRSIAVQAEANLGPQIVVGISRGGLIPATIIASLLDVAIHPTVVSRRIRPAIFTPKPQMTVSVGDAAAGRRILVVDESVLTGETMRMVSADCLKKGARTVKTASLWASTEGWKPTWYGMETMGHIMFPWDHEIIQRGKFILNPVFREHLDSFGGNH